MTNYDHFAPFYDAIMGDRQDVITIVSDLISSYGNAPHSLLELGCGTGSILAGFEGQYELFGIEKSPQMLKIAQQKLLNASFFNTTIAGYQLDRTFDLIICVFDTINHLVKFSDWQKLFLSTHQHLSTTGLFIFDMNTIGRLAALTAMPSYTLDFDSNKTMDMFIEPISHHQVQWHITIQEPETDGAIQVYEEHVNEAAFPRSQVEKTLAAYGFDILTAFDSNRAIPTDSSDRIYYACRLRPLPPSATAS